MLVLLLFVLLWWTVPVMAEGFRCAGSQSSEAAPLPKATAAKPARIAATVGTRQALVLFASFQVVVWNGCEETGQELARGVYFYRLRAGAQVETRKLLLLR